MALEPPNHPLAGLRVGAVHMFGFGLIGLHVYGAISYEPTLSISPSPTPPGKHDTGGEF